MRGLQLFSLVVLAQALTACGGETAISIAEDVRFRINFEDQTVQLEFKPLPEYRVNTDREILYGTLGKIALQDPTSDDYVSIKLSAETSRFSGHRGIQRMSLANGGAFPEPVKDQWLLFWSQRRAGASVSLVFKDPSRMVFGAEFLAPEFGELPTDFRGWQKFEDDGGFVRASLLVTGPTSVGYGGLYAFADLGENAFQESDRAMTPNEEVIPLYPQDENRNWSSLFSRKLKNLRQSLEERLSYFP